MLRGAGEIVDHLKQQIGVSSSEQVSPDGLFSFEEVECLGACEFAPMMRLDHRYHYDPTSEAIDTLIAERRGVLHTRGEVVAKAPKAPEGPAKKPRAPLKKKAAA